MNGVVVDTNVPVVANGRDTHADDSCRLACTRRIREIRTAETVFVDCENLIFEEYRSRLDFRGQPGVGDAFFRHVYNHQWSGHRVRRVPITQSGDERKGFEELPENGLDPSDRKFLAVAVVANAPIVNATDSDWEEQRALLDRLEVAVEQLCPQHARTRR